MRRLLAIVLLVAGCAGSAATPQIVYVTPTPDPGVFPSAINDPNADLPVGSGVISFGTAFDPDTLLITKPATRFKRTYSAIAWSASLSRPVGATSMQWIIASQSTSGTERTLVDEDQTVSSPDFDTFANSGDLALLVDHKAGTYVMRYIESGEVLAEGTFTLVK